MHGRLATRRSAGYLGRRPGAHEVRQRAEWLWRLMGFIDGEGFFTIRSSVGRAGYSCTFGVERQNSDSSVLADAQRLTGLGAISPRRPRKSAPEPVASWV